jgi:hypothetical protein
MPERSSITVIPLIMHIAHYGNPAIRGKLAKGSVGF